MGGKGSGNRSAKGVPYDKNPLWQAQDPKNVDKGTNHASIVFGMALFDLVREEVDLGDPEAVEREVPRLPAVLRGGRDKADDDGARDGDEHHAVAALVRGAGRRVDSQAETNPGE